MTLIINKMTPIINRIIISVHTNEIYNDCKQINNRFWSAMKYEIVSTCNLRITVAGKCGNVRFTYLNYNENLGIPYVAQKDPENFMQMILIS